MNHIDRSNNSTGANGSNSSKQDNSVMFSLSALMANASISNSTPVQQEPTDSGTIDLNALIDQKGPDSSHLAIFPLGAPEELTLPTPPISHSIAPRKRGFKKLVFFGAALLAAACMGATFGLLVPNQAHALIAASGVRDAVTTLAAQVQLPAVEPPPIVVVQPQPAPEPQPAPTVARPRPVPPRVQPPPIKTTTPTPPTPPKNSCNGDLDCEMKRAVGR